MTNRKRWWIFILVIVIPLLMVLILDRLFSNWYVEQNLGRGYTLTWMSNNVEKIMYGGSITVIDDPVYSCDHNRKWIIVKTKSKDYYIIDKRIPFSSKSPSNSVIGPMDSLAFYMFKDENGMNVLSLRTIPQNDR